MTIDIHSHIVPHSFMREIAKEVPSLAPKLSRSGGDWRLDYADGRRSGPVSAGMFDIDARLSDMSRDGIDTQVISSPPTMFGYRHDATENAVAIRLLNDSMIELAQGHPGRIAVFAALAMQDLEASLAELERVAPIPEVVGLQVGTNVAGESLGSARFSSLWAAIDASGLAVVLHPNDVAGRERMNEYYLENYVGNPTETTLAAGSLIFSGTLASNVALRVALLHGGGFLPYQIGRLDHGWLVRPESHARIEQPPSSFLSRFWFDTLTHDPASLQFLKNRVGPDRLLLGTDYPFDMSPSDPIGGIRAAFAAQPAVLDAVLEGTARSFISRRPSC